MNYKMIGVVKKIGEKVQITDKFAKQEINIETTPEAREFIMGSGHRTVPQIYHNGELFVEGGWQGLSKLSADEIKSRLNITDNPGTL